MASAASSAILPLPSAFRKWEPKTANTRRISAVRFVTRSTLSDNSGLLQAAKHTVDSYVRSGMVLGFGSGYASGLAIHYLGQQIKAGTLKDIVGIPTCVGSASEAAKAGIPLERFEGSSKIDLAFSDADIIEEETLSAVIGRRKMMAAEKLVFLVNEKQYKSGHDGSIPVLIQPFNWLETAEEIDDLFLGDAEVWRRPSVGHADPLGGDFPMVTKEGHNVLDLIFTSPINRLADIANSLDQVEGVVEHGVICRIPCTAVIATENGLHIVDNKLILEAGRT